MFLEHGITISKKFYFYRWSLETNMSFKNTIISVILSIGNITFQKVGLTLPCFNVSGNFDVLICVFNYFYRLSFSILPLFWFGSLC